MILLIFFHLQDGGEARIWHIECKHRPAKAYFDFINAVPSIFFSFCTVFAWLDDSMNAFIRLVGDNRTVEILGIRLVGLNESNLTKFLISAILLVALTWIYRICRWSINAALSDDRRIGLRRWSVQILRLLIAALAIIGLLSLWFDDPSRLTTAMGLFSAGLAFALQKVVTAIAGYFIILRGRNFEVGDRIVMGGVRGDVIDFGFTQTTIMEMGQPPAIETNADPAMWVKSRQYTGRIVTVSNARIFDDPVYNYTMDFPYIWEEMTLPIRYGSNYGQAESILRQAAEKQTVQIAQLSADTLKEFTRRYAVKPAEVIPAVYYRLTDNWIEMTVRFICRNYEVRNIKDQMSREILQAFEQAKIQIASSTQDISATVRMEQ